MPTCKVKSGIFDQVTLYSKTPETPENEDQGWVGFATQSTKEHIFFFKISKHVHNSDQEEPFILEINQIYLDTLNSGDFVEIFPYNIPEAKEVDFIFNSDEHTFQIVESIPSGECLKF